MVFEVVRGYVQLASGLGELTRARATEVAQGLLSLPAVGVATGGQMAVQVTALAEELMASAATNRLNLAALVRSEVDAAVTRLGLVSAEKLEESRTDVARLRAEVAQLRPAGRTAPRKTTAKKATAKKATAKKATAKKATAKKTTAKKTTAKKTTAKRATAKKTTAKKTTAKTTPANNAAAQRAAPANPAKPAKTATKPATRRGPAVTSYPKPAGA